MATALRALTGRMVRPRAAQAAQDIHLEGGFRPISTAQLVLVWWLYRTSHITRRQLRVYFACHEMVARREATQGRGRIRANYGLEELAALVGGRGSPEAEGALSVDLRRLGKVGLVTLTPHTIVFAASAEQITLPDVSGFHTLMAQIPNNRRTVPVPRRAVRALAGGFSRAVTGVMLATLIRSLFWHRESGYRLDGRTKGSWIAETFDISRRAVTDARATLIALGWLVPIATPQWQLNRWGAHDAINAAWAEPGQGRGAGQSASPAAIFPGQSASPDLNRSSSPTGNQNTRTPERPGPAGVSRNNQGRKKTPDHQARPVLLRDIREQDLASTERLLALYEQAKAGKLIDASEAGQLDFLAMAERARAHGARPGALFTWLLRGRRTKFITQADEEAAQRRLRAWRNEAVGKGGWALPVRRPEPRALSADERFLQLCMQVAKQQRIEDPFRVAFLYKRWTRPQWEAVQASYEAALQERRSWEDPGLSRISAG